MIDWFLDRIGSIIGLVVVAGIIVIAALGTYENEKDWQAYAEQHHCKTVGKKEGGISGGLDSAGHYVTVIDDDQTIYQCDAGEVRIR